MMTNALFERNNSFSIRYPPIGDILTVTKRSGNVKLDIISRKDYQEKYATFCSRFPECEREIPDYGDLMVAFYCADIPGLQDVEKVLQDEVSRHKVFQGQKPLWIAYDTNVLRHRFHSNIHAFLESKKLSGALGHVVAQGVIDEINRGMNNKYKPEQIKLLEKSFREASQFFNQLNLSARLHQIGVLDVNAIKKHDVFMRVKSGVGDEEIIKGYSRFEEDRRAEVLLFSNDSNFIQMASNNGIRTKLVKYKPHDVYDYAKENTITLDVISSILYHLSIVCGCIRSRGVSIYSIWSGKDANDWKNGSVMVVPEGNLKGPLQRNHKILKAMKDAKLW